MAVNSVPVHILLAEDNPGDQRLIAEGLAQHQLFYELQIVEDGESALRAAEAAGSSTHPPCPDLFILDLHLPRVDGLQVLRTFRANPNCVHTPVIVLTSSVSPDDRLEAESFPGVCYMQKPIDLDEFLKIGALARRLLLRGAGVC